MTRWVLGLSCLAVLLAVSAVQATPVAYWAFPVVAPTQNYEITWALPASEKLRSGVAQITTDAPVWDGTPPIIDILHQGAFQYFTGHITEAQPGYVAGMGLSMRAISYPDGPSEGKSLTFQFDATACWGIKMIMADRYTSTGPQHVDVSWSTDGSSFTSFPPQITTPRDTTWRSRTIDLSSVTALDNCATDYVKLTFTGFTNNSGAVRLDNIRFIPEPASLGFLLIGALLAFRRR